MTDTAWASLGERCREVEWVEYHYQGKVSDS